MVGSRAKLAKPLPVNGIGTNSLARRIGEQCTIIRRLVDTMGRTLYRVIFDDNEQRTVLDSDLEFSEQSL